MSEEYTYVKTNNVQKDMHDFVNQFGDEINSVSYVGNTIKLKNEVVYRFTYNTIGIRKYYTYTEIYNHHLKFQSKKLQKENQQLKEQLEKSEKARKEAIEYVKKRNFDRAEILVDMECEYYYDDDFKDSLLYILEKE